MDEFTFLRVKHDHLLVASLIYSSSLFLHNYTTNTPYIVTTLTIPITPTTPHRVASVKAVSHQGGRLAYEMVGQSGDFMVESHSGDVRLSRALDFEADPHTYHLSIKATDHTSARSSVVTVSGCGGARVVVVVWLLWW